MHSSTAGGTGHTSAHTHHISSWIAFFISTVFSIIRSLLFHFCSTNLWFKIISSRSISAYKHSRSRALSLVKDNGFHWNQQATNWQWTKLNFLRLTFCFVLVRKESGIFTSELVFLTLSFFSDWAIIWTSYILICSVTLSSSFVKRSTHRSWKQRQMINNIKSNPVWVRGSG